MHIKIKTKPIIKINNKLEKLEQIFSFNRFTITNQVKKTKQINPKEK